MQEYHSLELKNKKRNGNKDSYNLNMIYLIILVTSKGK